MQALARDAPRLRCELVEAEPEQSLPALAVGDVDLVLGDEWQHQPRHLPTALERHDLLLDPVHVSCPRATRPRRRHREAVPLAELAGEAWATGHAAMGWEEMTQGTCRELGGFDPDIRYRANDATISLALVARGLAVTLLPDLVVPGDHPGVALRAIAEGPVDRRDLRGHPRRRRGAALDPRAARRRARGGRGYGRASARAMSSPK